VENLFLLDVTKDPLPFHDCNFDNIVAGEFLEHISNFYFTMGEISRVLRPGGRIIITVPNIARLYPTLCVIRKKNYLRQFTKESIKKPDEHIHGFDEKLLASLLLHHDIETIHCDRLYNFYGEHKLPELRLFKVFALYVLVVGEKIKKAGK
ncbi:MAG: methyltransferase domain-containing protein, partial [Thermoplasmata archaeon]|nr:methyltransferase domain-containing protein [Thermoplasmata archaeon]